MKLILPRQTCLPLALTLATTWMWLAPTAADAQVRTKKPDREVYRSPVLQDGEINPAPAPLSELIRANKDVKLFKAPRPRREQRQPPKQIPAKWGAPLIDGEMNEVADGSIPQQQPSRIVRRDASVHVDQLQQAPRRQSTAEIVRHRGVQLEPPHRPQRSGNDVTVTGGEEWYDQGPVVYEGTDTYAPVIEGDEYLPGACDGCDGGCDSIDCGHRRSNAYLSLAPDRWFGSVELMLMFRVGDRPPPLVTTGPSDDADTAGELGQIGTQILVGGDKIFDDLTAGGRFTLGTWLDCQQNRKLMLRGWLSGEESFSFFRNQDQIDVLARPFFNVSDGQTAEQDTQLVIFPDRADGALSVTGDSEVFGADISVQQFYHGQYGLVTDLLYGYQFLKVDENLAIGSTSTSLSDDFAPIGAVISVADSFDIENEFHGGQLGMASSYREGCWSFRSLMKIGFGSLRRSANLTGRTTTNIDGAVAVDDNGLLVRSTNRGTHTDHTFAWVPELDFTLGWQRYQHFDLTFGYHVIAVTDALQASGAIDPSLSVNLTDPPTGQQRPTTALRYDTYYLQGIHFGLHYIY